MKKDKIGGVTWKRVSGPDLDEGRAEREKENQRILKNETFQKACEKAEVEPSKRQASKFKNKKGLAYKFGKIA